MGQFFSKESPPSSGSQSEPPSLSSSSVTNSQNISSDDTSNSQSKGTPLNEGGETIEVEGSAEIFATDCNAEDRDTEGMPNMGGYCETRDATPEVQLMVSGLQKTVEDLESTKFDEFIAVSFRSQVVAGINFKIKVFVGGEAYIHILVFRPLPHTGNPCEVRDVETGKKKDDPLL